MSGSSKLTKITDGAVSFDGSSDYLSVSDSDDFDLAGNNWTVEAFVYHNSTNYASYEGISNSGLQVLEHLEPGFLKLLDLVPLLI